MITYLKTYLTTKYLSLKKIIQLTFKLSSDVIITNSFNT